MPSERTNVTELATGLGMVGSDELGSAIAIRPKAMGSVSQLVWDQLASLWESGAYAIEFETGFQNGQAFLAAPDGLNGRLPRIIEWTGGRRPPGDEVVPSDLRVDHVYMVSCKYLSRILHNPSPARLVEGLLSQTPLNDGRDWYQRVAPHEHQELYQACRQALDGQALPPRVDELTTIERKRLAKALSTGWPENAASIYANMCLAVSQATAQAWKARITSANAQLMLWRLLRIGSAPYFILGTSGHGSMRLRVDTPWDWNRTFKLRSFDIAAQVGGQPRVKWSATYRIKESSQEHTVSGHVEVRWSHGRFSQPPEAKVYLDSAHEEVPGYHPL